MDNPASPRDGNGRFAPGGTGGPGRPKGKSYEFQRAGQDAITSEHYATMIRKAMRMALEGNLNAMRFVAERCVGRAPDAPVETPTQDITLPKLLSASDCAVAIDRVIAAMTAGTVDMPTARFLVDAVERHRRAIETIEHEERLADLEQQARSVDFGGNTRRN